MDQDIMVVSSNQIEGRLIKEYLGIVAGSIVKSRNAGSDIFAGLKSIVGGELVGYSKLLQRARDDAYQRMIEDAKSKGANPFLVRESVFKKGITPNYFYSEVVNDKMLNELKENVLKFTSKDVIISLKNEF